MTTTNSFGYKYTMQLLGALLCALALVGCGQVAAEDGAESSQAQESAPCGAGWTRHDVAPGACLAAWSAGYDWREHIKRPDARWSHEGFTIKGIHVDEMGNPSQCNDIKQFGLLVRAGDETLPLALKIDSGTIEEFAAGAPECDDMPTIGYDSF